LDGKYDAIGRRVAPVQVPLPFRTIETVNELAQERQRALSFDRTGADFSFTATVLDHPDSGADEFSFTKEPSIIEHKAYRDRARPRISTMVLRSSGPTQKQVAKGNVLRQVMPKPKWSLGIAIHPSGCIGATWL
jgi:hypothetical protein